VRPHRLHRHVDLDRPRQGGVRAAPDQPGEPDPDEHQDRPRAHRARGLGDLRARRLGRPPPRPHPIAAMNLSPIDWAIVFGYFALSTGIGFYFTKRGGESLSEYF